MVQARGIDRQFLSGLTIIVLLAAVVVGTLMQYNGVFRPSVDVVVEADRAGITMAPGAPVKLYGVEVGAVSDVDIDGDRAEITLELEPDQADSVPRDVTAQLVPPTAFGAKYVQLTVPEGASFGVDRSRRRHPGERHHGGSGRGIHQSQRRPRGCTPSPGQRSLERCGGDCGPAW